jgi:hypothetical protein
MYECTGQSRDDLLPSGYRIEVDPSKEPDKYVLWRNGQNSGHCWPSRAKAVCYAHYLDGALGPAALVKTQTDVINDPVATERRFPIMLDKGRDSIPWKAIAPHERQADRNHRQTLERLAQRGGLSWCEACAVMEDRPWRKMPTDEAEKRVRELCEKSQESPS